MLGQYPASYNPKVHGPYDPAIFYGKKDLALSEVKLKNLGSWLSRRNKSPVAGIQALSRSYWRWQHKYMLPEKSGIAPFVQFGVGAMAFFYLINYSKLKHHRTEKYHW